MKLFNFYIPIEIIWVLIGVFGVLFISTISFKIISIKKKNKLINEIILRINSWWKIAFGVAVIVVFPPIFGTILLAFVSFVSLREMFSIGRVREADRGALLIAYFAIPVQYFLAYNFWYEQFLYFIPLVMFMVLAIVLVLKGNTERVGRSMSTIPTMLMLTVYMLSHVALLYNSNFNNESGYGGLLIFLIMLTAFNDVFQFVWGKIIGRNKILPKVSPNKTWEGFIGGVLTTSFLAFALKFLTPFNYYEAIITGFVLGVFGFFGDTLISAIKRDLKLKDTDDLIPGHGGAMDRLDSIVLTAPVFFHLLKLFTII
ncbi:MAG: phosphatidate cytidylyltransferase [Putridiphycobacter sp.]